MVGALAGPGRVGRLAPGQLALTHHNRTHPPPSPLLHSRLAVFMAAVYAVLVLIVLVNLLIAM